MYWVFPCVKYPTEIQIISLALMFYPWLLNESKYALPLWISPSFFVSLYVSLSLSPIHSPSLSLESSFPKFTCGYPRCNISPRISVQDFTHHFPLSSVSLSNIKAVVQKEILCWYGDIPTRTYYFPLPIVSPAEWPADNLICAAVYVVTYLTQRPKYFQPGSHDFSSKN